MGKPNFLMLHKNSVRFSLCLSVCRTAMNPPKESFVTYGRTWDQWLKSSLSYTEYQ